MNVETFGWTCTSIFLIYCEKLVKFEMHVMSMEYSNTFLKQCNQCFPSFNFLKNDLKWFENSISMNKKWCAPLDYNIMQHVFS
jgi:hypothetical protein